MILENRISNLLLQSAFKVHKCMGPGLIPNVYRSCLSYELKQLGLTVIEDKKMPVNYSDLKIDTGYAIDLLVENRVIVLVGTKPFASLDEARMKTFLRLSGCKMGFLINFNVATLKHGVKRILNNSMIEMSVRKAI